MKKSQLVSILVALIGGFSAASVLADDTLVRFKGGIGVIPVRSLTQLNDVLGVQPPGRPWVIADLDVKVKTNGDITVKGKGLILGGGNNVGTGGGQQVQARLFCGGVAHNSGLVPLALNGDFNIDDVLTPLPPTNQCDNPVLLIVNSGGNWFAAGIPDLD